MQLSNDKYKIEVIKEENQSLIIFTFKGNHEINQDSYNYQLGKDVLLTIADGLGSALNSDIGSKTATSIAVEKSDMHSFNVETIFSLWKNVLEGKPLSQYDTTLKLAKITSNKINISSVGDGGILYQKDDSGYKIFQDNLDYVNETNSLLQSNDLETIVSFQDNNVSSLEVMMFTDGLELIIDENKLTDYAKQLKKLLCNSTEEELIEYLQEWIDSWLEKNIYDDVTMIYYMKEGCI